MDRTILQSNSYREIITDDGTDAGKNIGSLSATVDAGSKSINISAVLSQNTVLPANNIIQKQLDDFISEVRSQSESIGLPQFSEQASGTTTS